MALTLAAPAILLMAALVAMQYSEGEQRFATQLTAMTRALSLAYSIELLGATLVVANMFLDVFFFEG